VNVAEMGVWKRLFWGDPVEARKRGFFRKRTKRGAGGTSKARSGKSRTAPTKERVSEVKDTESGRVRETYVFQHCL
jgi:hypothetical protein